MLMMPIKRGAADSLPLDPPSAGKARSRLLAKQVLTLLRRTYFAGLFPAETQTYYARLLLAVVDAAEEGRA